MQHDTLIENLFIEYKKTSKQQIVSLFLASLSTRKLEWRIGLPIYAIMQNFPKHHYQTKDNPHTSTSPCAICSDYSDVEIDEDTDIYVNAGGVVFHSLADYYYGLKHINSIKEQKPTNNDWRIFNEIINILGDLGKNIRQVEKMLKKIEGFKSNEEERRLLLETLAYCGILKCKDHIAPFHQYTNLAIAPRKTHSSDWNYPADFWEAEDGIDMEILNFWFDDFFKTKNKI